MGIQGLLPNVDCVSIKGNISSFKGKRVAIDIYGWLHRSVANSAESIVLGRPTKVHINYCTERIKALKIKGITPICIFDGASLPMKKVTEEERSKKRDSARKEIVRLRREKKSVNSYMMRTLCQKALDITPTIAHQVLEVLRDEYNVECIVAPYEADAQLSYLSRKKYVDAVLTEDSDMLVFGSLCTIYKYDDKTGFCRVIYWKDLYKCGIIPQGMFTYGTFVLGCTLTGCDYVKSPQGVGIKTAMKLVHECNANLDKIILQLQELGKKIPENYSMDVQRAVITFYHQTVYDPIEKKMVPLSCSELPESGIENSVSLTGMPIFVEFNQLMKQGNTLRCNRLNEFVGPIIQGKIVGEICLGFVHPETRQIYGGSEDISEILQKHEKNDETGDRTLFPEECNLSERENRDTNVNETEVEELIKQSIGSPINRTKPNCKRIWHKGKYLTKRRRAIWINPNSVNSSAGEDKIKSLDQFALKHDKYA
ncbi:PIN domain-like protein [Cryptosporidium felis]|nr:PIN domain-like protein [Cryptosporidium felis]